MEVVLDTAPENRRSPVTGHVSDDKVQYMLIKTGPITRHTNNDRSNLHQDTNPH